MTHIKTSSGFEADIDEDKMDDYRLLAAIQDARKSTVAVVDIIRLILGDAEERLIDHLIEKTGGAKMDDVQAEMMDIFEQLKESKKK